jgi:hypothetical protein
MLGVSVGTLRLQNFPGARTALNPIGTSAMCNKVGDHHFDITAIMCPLED